MIGYHELHFKYVQRKMPLSVPFSKLLQGFKKKKKRHFNKNMDILPTQVPFESWKDFSE